MANRHMKRCSNHLPSEKNAHRNYGERSLHTRQSGSRRQMLSAAENAENLDPWHGAGGKVNWDFYFL